MKRLAIESLRRAVGKARAVINAMPESAFAEARSYRKSLAATEIELRCLDSLYQSRKGDPRCEVTSRLFAILADRLAVKIASLSLDGAGIHALPDQRSLGHNERIGAVEADGSATDYFATVAHLAKAEFDNYAVLAEKLLSDRDEEVREAEMAAQSL